MKRQRLLPYWIIGFLISFTPITTSAAIEISCPQTVIKVEQTIDRILNLRKTSWAALTLPRDARLFDVTQFNFYRDLFTEKLKSAETFFLPETFESKLAFLEALATRHSDKRLEFAEAFQALPAEKKKSAYKLVNELLSGKLNPREINKVSVNLQAILMEDFYGKVFEGLSQASRERTLMYVTQARYMSRGVVEVFSQMEGMLGTPGLAAFAKRVSKLGSTKIAFHVALNTGLQSGLAVARPFIGQATTVLTIKIPKWKVAQMVKIPDEMFDLIADIGFERAWEAQIKTYLVKKYGNTIAIDNIYQIGRKAYDRIVNTYIAVFIGIGAFTTYKELEKDSILLEELNKQFKEQEKADRDAGGPTEIPKSDLDKMWDDWVEQNPEAAKNPNSEDYKAAHEVIYGN